MFVMSTCLSEFSLSVSRVFSSKAFSFIRSVLRDSALRRDSLSAVSSLSSCSNCKQSNSNIFKVTHYLECVLTFWLALITKTDGCSVMSSNLCQLQCGISELFSSSVKDISYHAVKSVTNNSQSRRSWCKY